jgi:hypothetical protein
MVPGCCSATGRARPCRLSGRCLMWLLPALTCWRGTTVAWVAASLWQALNSAAIASRVRGAELRGYDGGHLFLFQDPAALPEFEAFLQAPPRRPGSS